MLNMHRNKTYLKKKSNALSAQSSFSIHMCSILRQSIINIDVPWVDILLTAKHRPLTDKHQTIFNRSLQEKAFVCLSHAICSNHNKKNCLLEQDRCPAIFFLLFAVVAVFFFPVSGLVINHISTHQP